MRPRVAIRVVRADGGPETVVPMTKDVLTSGKIGDLPLPDDPFVADQQVRFYFAGTRLAVEDVGGGNGVFSRLRAEREVSVGGEVRIGRQRLLMETVTPAVPAADGSVMWGSPDPGYRYRLVQLLEGGGRGHAFPLREGEHLVGREQGEIVFPGDGFVSGRHAALTVVADKMLLRDMGSSNGTFIRLNAPTFVDNGDQFLIGRQLVRVEIQA